jgi:anhydro-N-acetylmuramic acid kinase
LADRRLKTAIGLMSGTSMDGIDVALLRTDGEDVVACGPAMTVAYERAFRRRIGEAIGLARTLEDRMARPAPLDAIEQELTDLHAQAVDHFLTEHGIDASAIDVVGFHGQTVLHRPEARLTVQVGDGQRLADTLDLPVAWDLRADDVAAGGQGAPLAPVYHRAMLPQAVQRPVAVLNIGGVANVTWIGEGDDDLIAFDTGPGNALLDDWMAKTIGASRDEGGAAATAGSADQSAVDFFLTHDFFKTPPPKSLDRNAFFWDLIDGLSVADGAATLVAMTVGAIARAVAHMPSAPQAWVVCGGGRHNAAIMQALARELSGEILAAEAFGLDGDAIEAQAWAYLAVRSAEGLALTYPGTTGVAAPLPGGRLSVPRTGRHSSSAASSPSSRR